MNSPPVQSPRARSISDISKGEETDPAFVADLKAGLFSSVGAPESLEIEDRKIKRN